MGSRNRVCVVAAAVGILFLAACGDDSLEADAGPDFTTPVGSAPTFDGCGSNGDIVNYAWSIAGTPSGMDADVGKSLREEMTACSFELEAAMLPGEVGVWTIELVVTDADGSSSSDQVDVEVTGG